MFTYINVKETYFFSHTVHYCSFSIHIRSERSFFMPVSLRNGFRVCWVYPVCWLDSSHRPEQALATIFLEVSPPTPVFMQPWPCWGRGWGQWQHSCDFVTSRSNKSPDSPFEGTVTENTIYISLWIERLYLLHYNKKKKKNSNSHYIQYGTFNCRKLLVMDHLILGLHLVREV